MTQVEIVSLYGHMIFKSLVCEEILIAEVLKCQEGGFGTSQEDCLTGSFLFSCHLRGVGV